MIQVLLFLWVVSALFIVREQKVTRIIIYFCTFSLITSACFLVLGAPDVAMAEGAVGAFMAIFFIICFEKFCGFGLDISKNAPATTKKTSVVKKVIIPLIFAIFLLGLFVHFIPNSTVNTYLKYQYVSLFRYGIGGENAVTAIYLGYRIYDTLFEALMLLVGVMAVVHVSWSTEPCARDRQRSPLKKSDKAVFIVRIICPIILLFGVYLVAQGFLTPGGGFQGGVLIAAFFVCRYMVYDINDMPIIRLIYIEKIIFIGITLVATFVVFLGLIAYLPATHLPIFQNIYLITMNALIAVKVTCGFVILFYRYIAIERR